MQYMYDMQNLLKLIMKAYERILSFFNKALDYF